MAKKIYLSQIQAEIDLLERERQQVLEHLALVDSKLDKLRAAIEVMNDKGVRQADSYNTELYTYKTYKRSFNGKLRQLLLAELKAEPDRYFTVNELIKLVLVKCGQEPIIQPQHTVSMRGALRHWLNKGIVERIEYNVVNIRWRLKHQ